jgi:hypothetical protein
LGNTLLSRLTDSVIINATIPQQNFARNTNNPPDGVDDRTLLSALNLRLLIQRTSWLVDTLCGDWA